MCLGFEDLGLRGLKMWGIGFLEVSGLGFWVWSFFGGFRI